MRGKAVEVEMAGQTCMGGFQGNIAAILRGELGGFGFGGGVEAKVRRRVLW